MNIHEIHFLDGENLKQAASAAQLLIQITSKLMKHAGNRELGLVLNSRQVQFDLNRR